jgi:hypothetical protein
MLLQLYIQVGRSTKVLGEYLNLHSIDDGDDDDGDNDALPVAVAVQGKAQAFAVYIHTKYYVFLNWKESLYKCILIIVYSES